MEVEQLIDRSDDPLGAVREMMTTLEGALGRLRARLRAARQEAQELKDGLAQQESNFKNWEKRSEKSAADGHPALLNVARKRKEKLELEIRESEKKWWDKVQETGEMESQLSKLEEKIQTATKHFDTLMAKRRRDLPSSDFFSIPRQKADDDTRGRKVEEELHELKKKRKRD